MSASGQSPPIDAAVSPSLGSCPASRRQPSRCPIRRRRVGRRLPRRTAARARVAAVRSPADRRQQWARSLPSPCKERFPLGQTLIVSPAPPRSLSAIPSQPNCDWLTTRGIAVSRSLLPPALLLAGLIVLTNGAAAQSSRDLSTPSRRLVGHWVTPGNTHHYFGTTDSTDVG